MQKLYSQLLGMPVFEEYTPQHPVSYVRDVVMDPGTGKLLAFVVRKGHIIVPSDIAYIHSAIFIHDRDRIVHPTEVLRVTEVLKCRVPILAAPVYTQQTKQYLGRVIDFTCDLTQMVLSEIEVAKFFLFFQYDSKIIPSKSIVKINQKGIWVMDTTKKTREQVIVPESSPSPA